MSSTHSFKILGGLGAVTSGILFFLAHFLNLFGNSEFGTVLGASLVFAAHLVVVFAFIGLYEAQAERRGLLGMFGMVLGVVGTIVVCAIVYVEIAGASGVDTSLVFNSYVPNLIKTGSLIFVAGMLLFGISTMLNNILPRWGGLLLVIGTIIFALGSFAGNAGPVFSAIGGAITGGGFVWLGIPLLYSNKLKNSK
ncbi:hypothetical protein O9H85_31780 [Paenibacillus filicis]|uniref:DUF4386 family protein n=1 Tax=Paenibacillus gyeongsangnamensis TaxID=3388067 RepID=A0ABT4QIZ6_9BACL|nr:hypothetical protein [Paenibacillus filicis]MCZ8516863.1 hypothetical protein [Paenibacillus filicis]